MRRLLVIVVATLAVALIAGVAWWVAFGNARTTPPGWYARTVYPLEHAGAIRASARRNHLDPALVAAIIYAESRFDDHARSAQGAMGLMQVLPETAQQIARETGGARFVTADLEDPRVNLRYGTYFLRRVMEQFHGDTVAAVAAYNAGAGAVAGWERAARAAGHGLRAGDIPYPETRAYVRNVLRLRTIYRRTYGNELR